MTDPRDILTEDEARRLWQKAAQLQAEAARLAEAKASHDAEGDVEGPRRDGEGYALVHVRAAAVEAGISEEFVDAALAAVRAEGAVEGGGGAEKYRFSRFVMGNPPGSVESRRTVRAAPELLPHEPYTLTLMDRIGDPLRGGTLAFDIQGVGFATAGNPGFKGDAAFADLRKVYVTLVPLPGSPARCEVTVRAPVAWALRLNAGISLLAAGMGGGLGVGMGFAAATALGLIGSVAAPLLVATAAGVAGAGSLGGLRAVYRYGLGRGTKALDGLLAAVAAKAEGGWGIAEPTR